MNKTIVGVEYRHAMPTAYITIIGRSAQSAERNAKKVGTALKEMLPKSAVIGAMKDVGPTKNGFLIEVPIIIAECEPEARAILGALVLKGAA